MSPQSASRGPVERGYVERYLPCPDRFQFSSTLCLSSVWRQGGLGRENYVRFLSHFRNSKLAYAFT